jgi:hypothetical protein
MARTYLVAHDYGMGAVWAVVTADSADAIVRKFPELTVVSCRPPWLNDEEYERLPRLKLDPPTGFLQTIVEERPPASPEAEGWSEGT